MPRSEASLSDEWETPQSLYKYLCARYGFYPSLDVCATEQNKKCASYIGLDHIFEDHRNALETSWGKRNWCNPPHSKTEEFVRQACFEFLAKCNETMMIIPANSTTTTYAESCIEPHAESYPIYERPRFKQDGVTKDSARNGYYVIIWRVK